MVLVLEDLKDGLDLDAHLTKRNDLGAVGLDARLGSEDHVGRQGRQPGLDLARRGQLSGSNPTLGLGELAVLGDAAPVAAQISGDLPVALGEPEAPHHLADVQHVGPPRGHAPSSSLVGKSDPTRVV